jgi:hypothetical protein
VEKTPHGALAVGISAGKPFAVSNRCRHLFAPLGKGRVTDDGCAEVRRRRGALAGPFPTPPSRTRYVEFNITGFKSPQILGVNDVNECRSEPSCRGAMFTCRRRQRRQPRVRSCAGSALPLPPPARHRLVVYMSTTAIHSAGTSFTPEGDLKKRVCPANDYVEQGMHRRVFRLLRAKSPLASLTITLARRATQLAARMVDSGGWASLRRDGNDRFTSAENPALVTGSRSAKARRADESAPAFRPS